MYRDPQPHVNQFAEKQGLNFDEWLNENVLIFDGYWFISFDDVVTDLELNVPKGEILKYYESENEKTYLDYLNYFTKSLP